MAQWIAFQGEIKQIQPLTSSNGCNLMVSVEDRTGAPVNFIVTPQTYVVGQTILLPGDIVTGWYDGNRPAILIYPPQFEALVMAKESANYQVKVDFFNENLVSSDGMLKLNPTQATEHLLPNGQAFVGNIANRNLIVLYGPSTKSIPAQTIPYQIIVLC